MQIELVGEYLEEAAEFVDGFEAALIGFEQTGAAAIVGSVLSMLHTFKGNSGMIGFPALQTYAHRLEDLFKAIEAGTIEFDSETAEFAMHSVNVIRDSLENIDPQDPQDPDLDDEIALAETMLDRADNTAANSPGASVKAESSASSGRKTDILKVKFQRLDQLLNLMGELVIYYTRLKRIDTLIEQEYGDKGLMRDLGENTEQIGKIVDELHRAIMKVRMLPVKNVFSRFPRLVRDLAAERGKDVVIHFEGEETELDKTVVDQLGEPLLHLIRNSIDHGIESPEERAAAGKPARSEILVKAYQASGKFIVRLEDDGRGIDEQKLISKARAAGVLGDEAPDRQSILELIFEPGLSTADKLSEISGRGLGMDIVKKSLAKINGSIEVESEPGLGTSFTIKLPLTLAIISALRVGAGGEEYAIPLSSVKESVKIGEDDIHVINGRETLDIRGRLMTVLRFSDLFGLPRSSSREVYAVVVERAAGETAFIVDSLLGKQEIVIKSMGDYMGATRGIAGATIMGDGKVVLIVDVNEMAEGLAPRRGRAPGEARADA